MYSNVLQYSHELKWLSRVHKSIKKTKELLTLSNTSLNWQPLDNGYSYHVTTSKYKGVEQRWVMIFLK